MFPSGIEQSSKNREPLRLIKVEPPKSPEQFIGLDDDGIPPIDLMFNRPLTTYETYAVSERFPDAEVSSDGAFSDTGHGIVTVRLPFARLNDAAGLVNEVSGISKTAAAFEGRHRERLEAWYGAAKAINDTLW